jgi:hypothetical protein
MGSPVVVSLRCDPPPRAPPPEGTRNETRADVYGPAHRAGIDPPNRVIFGGVEGGLKGDVQITQFVYVRGTIL